jgi:hypothetical protein
MKMNTLSKKIKTKIEYGALLLADELWNSSKHILREISAAVDFIAFLKFMRDKKVGIREKFGPLVLAVITRSKIVASMTVEYYRRRIKAYRKDAERTLSGA